MRKAFVWAALAAVVVTADSASAQIEWGPVAGLSLANLSGDDADGFDSRTGFFAGAQVVWQRPGSLLGFETGAVYIQKGAEASEDGVDGALELTYIDVPLLVRIAPPLAGSSFTPAFGLGANLGFNIDCKLSGEADGVSADIDCDEAGLEVKSIDLGLTASAGVDFPVGTTMMLAPFVSYTFGLSSIDDSAEDADVKNSVIKIGAALRFGGR